MQVDYTRRNNYPVMQVQYPSRNYDSTLSTARKSHQADRHGLTSKVLSAHSRSWEIPYSRKVQKKACHQDRNLKISFIFLFSNNMHNNVNCVRWNAVLSNPFCENKTLTSSKAFRTARIIQTSKAQKAACGDSVVRYGLHLSSTDLFVCDFKQTQKTACCWDKS
jgi:hypothetical protein